jgi:hypothetical protein
MSNLCKAIDELKRDIKELKDRKLPCVEQTEKCGRIFNELDNRIDRRIKWTQLSTIILVLIGIFSSVILYNFNNDTTQFEKLNSLTERVIKNEQILRKLP